MNKTGFYCSKCNSIPLIQIVPKIENIKIFYCCKCSKKLINYESFMKNYFVNNINYENVSNETFHEEYIDFNYKDMEKNLLKIKENFLNIEQRINNYLLEIKNKIVDLLEKKINKVKQIYEMNKKNNQKLHNLIEILINNYHSNENNISNKKNLIYNTHFNFGYLNNISNPIRFDNAFPLSSLVKNVIEYIEKTYILSNNDEKIYTFKKFFNHSKEVTCLIELSQERIASSSTDSFINLYNLETKKPLYKYNAHNNAVNWIDKIYKNSIISCGDDSLIKIWPEPQLDFKEEINSEKFYSVTYSETLNIEPITTLNINDNIIKFIFLNDKLICASSKNKLYLIKYEIIINEKDENNLLNVNLNIINCFDLNENKFIDLLKFNIHENKEFIFLLGSKSLCSFSTPDLTIISKFNEYNNHSPCSCLTKLNKDEIIYSNGPTIKIFNINSFKIKFQYTKNSKSITFLTKLNDNTLLISTEQGVFRYDLKHFEEISLITTIYSNLNGFYIHPIEKEKINYIYEFANGRLGICSSYGNIKICKFQLS